MQSKLIPIAAAGLITAFLLGCQAQTPAEPETTVPTFYDLTGEELTVEAYRAFCQEHPDAEIIWEIPFQGTRYTMDTTQLTVSALTQEDLSILPLFPNLTRIDASECTDLELIPLIKETLPQCDVLYRVPLGGNAYPSDTEELTLSDVSAQEIVDAIPLLTNVKTIRLSGLPDNELKTLIAQFPDVFFLCNLEFGGKTISTDSTEIDLSGTRMTVQETEALLSCFPKLEKLDLSNCGMSNEALDELNRAHPQTRIVWTLMIGNIKMRTDDTIFYPSRLGEQNLPNNEELKKLRFCPDIIALDIGHSRATECDWLESMPHVKYLILADSKITDLSPLQNLKELVYLEVFSLDISDYSPLLGCTALQDLNISNTHADPAPLTQMTWLHNLQWYKGDTDPATRDAVLQLENQLPDTNIVIDTFRNVGALWRYLPHYYIFRDYIGGNYYNQSFIIKYWGTEDATRIMSTDGKPAYAGDVLAEIVKERMEQGLPIPGIRNIGSEKEEILYRSLLTPQP